MYKSIKTILILVAAFHISCHDSNTKVTIKNDASHKEAFLKTMQNHLDAVSNKDLKSLESTLSPTGKMQLILPKAEVKHSVSDFMEYHREWFKDTTWSFKTKITDTTIGETMGIAIVEIVYSEPERDGKPYYHRMTVSYALEMQEDIWYVVKDHASSIEKSTD